MRSSVGFENGTDQHFVSNDTILRSTPVGTSGIDYARHDGFETGSIANLNFNEDAPLLIGNLMQFFDVYAFRQVLLTITDDSTNLGQFIFVQILKYNPETGAFVNFE